MSINLKDDWDEIADADHDYGIKKSKSGAGGGKRLCSTQFFSVGPRIL